MALAPTQTVEGHDSGGVSLLCKNTQATLLLSTYPSLQRRTQEGNRSLPRMATTQSTIETKNNYHSILKCETRENTKIKGKTKIKTEDMLKDEAIIFLRKINITKQNL